MKVFKTVRRLLLVLVLLVIVAVGVVWFYLDRIVKRTVETQATTSLNLPTSLGGASLSLIGGKVGLSDLQIASPPGFAAPNMLTLGKANVAVSYGQLRSDPMHVGSITLERPTLVIEQQGGQLNFKKAADNLPAGDPKPKDSSEPLKMIIDELTIKDPKVIVRPGIPGLPEEINVPVGSFTMKNVGTGDGSQNGAAVKDVVMQVITALAAQANASGSLPSQFKELLTGSLAATMGKLTGEAQKRIMAALPGPAGQALSGIVADPAAALKDPGKALTGALGGLTGNGGTATTGPSLPEDPAKSASDALGGLLGGSKKEKSTKKK